MFVSAFQIFRPGGCIPPSGGSSGAGTPNLLLDLTNQLQKVQWQDSRIGGQHSATFEFMNPYESSGALNANNWVLFGALGGILSKAAPAGSNTISVQGAYMDASGPPRPNILRDSDTLSSWLGFNSVMYAQPGYGVYGRSVAVTIAGTGSISQQYDVYSPIIYVVPGRTYVISGYIDATGVTAGVPYIALYDVAISTPYVVKYATVGSSLRIDTTWTCPAGVTQVRFILDAANATIAPGFNLLMSNPQMELCQNLLPYSDTLDTWQGWTTGTYGMYATPNYLGGGQTAVTIAGSNVPCGQYDIYSPVISVAPGKTYFYSAFIDATGVTAGNPFIAIFNPNIDTSYAVTYQTPGVASRIRGTWVCPLGVTQVRFLLDAANVTISSGYGFYMYAPLLELYALTNYLPALFAPNEFQVGDNIMITDSNNTDLFQVSGFSGSDPQTVVLSPGWGQGTTTTLNTYAAASTVCRILYQGRLVSTPHRIDQTRKDMWAVQAAGFGSRYQDVSANADIVKQDGAVSVLSLAQSYVTTLPEIIVDPKNFDTSNGILCSTSTKEGALLKLINDILTTENSQTNNAIWAFWVDEVRCAHHAQIPSIPASVQAATYSSVAQLIAALFATGFTPYQLLMTGPNSNGDRIADIATTDQDITTILNCAVVYGGSSSQSTVPSLPNQPPPPQVQPTRIIVRDVNSIQNYGYAEGTLQNPDVTDEATLSAWAAGKLAVMGYPQSSTTVTLSQTQCRITARSMVSISGFDDGSTFVNNVSDIQYHIDKATLPLIGAQFTMREQHPPLAALIAGIANQKAFRVQHEQPNTHLLDQFVVRGFDLSVGP